MDRPETIEETAEQVTAAGGRGIAVRTDHSRPGRGQGAGRPDRGRAGRAARHPGQLRLGRRPADRLGAPLWEQDLDNGPAAAAAGGGDPRHHQPATPLPLMVARGRGLVVEVTDGNTARYRGSFFYDLAKSAVIRLARGAGRRAEAARRSRRSPSRPGFLRSEAMLDHFGVTEANWRDGAAKDPDFADSETPGLPGPGGRRAGRRPRRAWPGPAGRSPHGASTRSTASPTPTARQPDWAAHWAQQLADKHGPLGDPL